MDPRTVQSFDFEDGPISVGDRFGTRTVVALHLTNDGRDAYADTRCDCGKRACVWASNLGATNPPGRAHVCKPTRLRPLPPDELTKQHARDAVSRAVASGLLVRPKHCSLCGQTRSRIVGHHRDYAHPLAVVWCCDGCHAAEHMHARKATAPASAA